LAAPKESPPCTIMRLSPDDTIAAARNAVAIYPGNHPPVQQFASLIRGDESDVIYPPLRIAALTDKYWGPTPRVLPVSFLDTPDAATRRLILEHMNAWTKTACIRFVESSDGRVRIAREKSGYWSYLGTDILMIPPGEATMNLQGFTAKTPLSEYKRVVRHETGHTLGFPHEHMRRDLVARIDREKAIDYFHRTQYWSRRDVEAQVLTPLDEQTLMATPADQTSIMCYQLPGSITTDGKPIVGGLDIDASDYKFAGSIYPLPPKSPRSVAS
jgi:hypothetical protein